MNRNPTRIPAAWAHLRPGEMMASKLPLHRLEAIGAALNALGVCVRFEPMPTGYFVVCESRTEAQNADAELYDRLEAEYVRATVEAPVAPGEGE